MKRIALVGVVSLVAICGAHAAFVRLASIAPTAVAVTAKNDPSVADATLAAPSAGRNCLTHLSAQSAGAAVLRVLSAGTTVYNIDLIANQQFVMDRAGEEALCGTALANMELKVTTSAAGAFRINYQGFIY